MARRGRKKKVKLNIGNDTKNTFFGLILIALSLITLVIVGASFAGSSSTLASSLLYVFGYSSVFLVPFLFVFGLIKMKYLKWFFVDPRVLIGLGIILIFSSGLFHIRFYDDADAWNAVLDYSGGGVIGYYLNNILLQLLGFYGTIILHSFFVLGSVFIIFDKSFDDVAGKVTVKKNKQSYLAKLFSMVKKRRSRLKQIEESLSSKESSSEPEYSSYYEKEPNPSEKLFDKSQEKYVEPKFEFLDYLKHPFSYLTRKRKSSSPKIVNNKSSKAKSSLASDVIEVEPYEDFSLPYSDKVWELPPLDLLSPPKPEKVDAGDTKARAKKVEEALASFGIEAKVQKIQPGPAVTQYALSVAKGTKTSKISTLANDLALALASPSGTVRIEAPIPGTSLIGIEVPNNNRLMVSFKELLVSDKMKKNKSKRAIVLGKDVGGNTMIYDIASMPHLLVAGATGSGKSIFIQTLLFSLLYRAGPDEVKLILIDPKRVELAYYNDIPHLYTPVITDLSKAPAVFDWAVKEMERRYSLLESAKVQNIDSYNEKSGFQALPYIVIVADEMAEIMMSKESSVVEGHIMRIAQLSRAVGIHLVLATQRPSTNILTGLIKANIPTRVAFNVTSNVDSRVIIDTSGAEKLLGKGDMLFQPPDRPIPVRLQGAYVSEKEILQLVDYLKSRGIKPDYKEEIFAKAAPKVVGGVEVSDEVDEYFNEAVDIVQAAGKGSASLLQRRLSVGYTRAARILDELTAHGIVGPPNGSKPRELLKKL
jgi:S-DNA-T family DNA segregation ATPase FtsK/SpoIIIE